MDHIFQGLCKIIGGSTYCCVVQSTVTLAPSNSKSAIRLVASTPSEMISLILAGYRSSYSLKIASSFNDLLIAKRR